MNMNQETSQETSQELQAALDLLGAEYSAFLSLHSKVRKPARRKDSQQPESHELPWENKSQEHWDKKNQIPSTFDPTELHNPLSHPGYIPEKG